MNNRLDIELVNKGLVESREKAKALIMAGAVYIDGQKAYKAGDKIKEGQMIEIKGENLNLRSLADGNISVDGYIESVSFLCEYGKAE